MSPEVWLIVARRYVGLQTGYWVDERRMEKNFAASHYKSNQIIAMQNYIIKTRRGIPMQYRKVRGSTCHQVITPNFVFLEGSLHLPLSYPQPLVLAAHS